MRQPEKKSNADKAIEMEIQASDSEDRASQEAKPLTGELLQEQVETVVKEIMHLTEDLKNYTEMLADDKRKELIAQGQEAMVSIAEQSLPLIENELKIAKGRLEKYKSKLQNGNQ